MREMVRCRSGNFFMFFRRLSKYGSESSLLRQVPHTREINSCHQISDSIQSIVDGTNILERVTQPLLQKALA
jgi:hypothetical protein